MRSIIDLYYNKFLKKVFLTCKTAFLEMVKMCFFKLLLLFIYIDI